MPIYLPLAGNGIFSPPGGYPLRLSSVAATLAEGVIPGRATKVSATVKAVAGVTPAGAGAAAAENTLTTATVHLQLLALYSGLYWWSVAEEVSADLGSEEVTLAVTVPAEDADENVLGPVPMVVQLWVETEGTNAVEISKMWME